MNEDFLDFLRALAGAGARFLVVGAHAVAVHGVPHATQDLDILVDPSPGNAERVWNALAAFGAPLTRRKRSISSPVGSGLIRSSHRCTATRGSRN